MLWIIIIIITRLVGCVAVFRRQRGLWFFLLPRRLANGSQLPPSATAAPGPPVTDSAGPRFHYQLGQVGAHPDSVPESGDYRYPPAAGAAQPEEDRHNCGGGPATPWPTASPGQDMASVPGFSLEPSRRPSGLPTAHAPAPAAFSQELPTGPGPPIQTGPPAPTIRLLFRRWSRPEFLRTGNPLRVPQPTITVTTDASHTGWGVTAGAALLMGTGPATGYSPISMCWSFRLSFCHSITSSPLFGTALYLSVRTTSQWLHT